jgi:hypothetical protein
MRTLRSNVVRAAQIAIAASVLGGASVAHAQWWPSGANGRSPNNSQLVFEWQGRVDREVQFDVNGRGVDVRGVNGDNPRGRLQSRGSLPRGDGRLIVQRLDGRGNVDIVQQPSSSNNGRYGNNGVVRIRDTEGGADNYRIRVYWQSNGSTYGSNNGDRNDRNDRADDRRDRRDRRDDRRDRRDDRRDQRDDRRDDRRGRP